MCEFLKPDPPEIPEPKEPEVLVNPFEDLDEKSRAARARRRGIGSLVIPLSAQETGLGIGFSGRGVGSSSPRAGSPTSSTRTGLSIGSADLAASASTKSMKDRQPFEYWDGMTHQQQRQAQAQDDLVLRALMKSSAGFF